MRTLLDSLSGYFGRGRTSSVAVTVEYERPGEVRRATKQTHDLEIYRELGTRLSTRPEKQEVTAAFAGGGLVLLLAGMAASMLRGGRLP